MDPSIISAGIGVIGGLLGGKPKEPGYVRRQYELQNSIWQKALGLYNNTDLVNDDAQALDRYSSGAMQRAQQLLANYDGTRAAQSGRVASGDTASGRGRSQIAADAALRVSDLGAQLDTTRAQRKAALLPSAAGAAGGFQSAAYLDAAEMQRQAAQNSGLLDLGKLIAAQLTKKRGGAPSVNDATTPILSGNVGFGSGANGGWNGALGMGGGQ